MRVRWLALGLSFLLATAAYSEPAKQDKPAERPAAKSESAEKPAAKSEKATKAKKSDEKADKKGDASAGEAKPASDEPKTTTVDKLPGALKTAHVCAMPKATVEIDSERYEKSVVFIVSCTAAKGGLTPFAVYVARDAKGAGAKLVTFEGVLTGWQPVKAGDAVFGNTSSRSLHQGRRSTAACACKGGHTVVCRRVGAARPAG